MTYSVQESCYNNSAYGLMPILMTSKMEDKEVLRRFALYKQKLEVYPWVPMHMGLPNKLSLIRNIRGGEQGYFKPCP